MPRPGIGRPYPTHTKLGRIMADRGLTAMDVAAGSGIYTRTMTELLSGRTRPSARSLNALTSFLNVSPDAILEDSYPHLAVKVPV